MHAAPLDVPVDHHPGSAVALVPLGRFRGDCVTATTLADHAQATAKLVESAAELTIAAEAVTGLLELARITAASGRTGKPDLN